MKIHKATFRCSPSQTAFVLHDVQKRGKIRFLLVFTVDSVINCDKADTLLREENFCIKSNLQIVTAQPGHILDNDGSDFPGFNLGQHFLETRTLEICSRVSVVYEKADIPKTMVSSILGNQFLLMNNGVTVTL